MCDAAKSGGAGERVLTETYDNVQKEAAGGNLSEDLPKQLQRSLLIGEWLATLVRCSAVRRCLGKLN